VSLFVASLNSGSNGNCYYVGNAKEGVLVDAGISCRETERRLKYLGLSIKMIKAIFITHEHADHINGLAKLIKKHFLPVYITTATHHNLRARGRDFRGIPFEAYVPITIGNLRVEPIPKFHDAADPYSFIISDGGINVGVFTDTGRPCENLQRYFAICHAAFLESNYDDDMLERGPYPVHLKNRIRGGFGHLSNRQALQVYLTHRSPSLTHLILSHLSAHNNKPELVAELFAPVRGQTEIVVAGRKNETELYEITGAPIAVPGFSAMNTKSRPAQLSLFENA